MPRRPREVFEGIPHHITHRGLRKTNIFSGDRDRTRYLSILKESSNRFGIDIAGYCLMDNHIHLVLVPKKQDSLANVISRTHSMYAQYFNIKNNLSGHLFEKRFFSCPVFGDDHLVRVLRYVDLNPVRAGIVNDAIDFHWSSAREHAGFQLENTVLSKEVHLQSLLLNWDKVLLEPLLANETQNIRLNTLKGKPLRENVN